MTKALADDALDLLFRDARTHNGWRDEPVTEAQLVALYDLAKMGPTSANQQPMRIKFIRSAEAKARLKPHLSPGNVDKTMSAPVTALIGYDFAFYTHMARLFPHNADARTWFEGKPEIIATNAVRNGTLQAGYFILAARAVGLDCGPMSGFDYGAVDRLFWAGTEVKSNLLCNLGRGDPAKVFPRSPRFDFAEVCEVL